MADHLEQRIIWLATVCIDLSVISCLFFDRINKESKQMINPVNYC